MGVIALLHRPIAGWCQCQHGRFHPLARERTRCSRADRYQTNQIGCRIEMLPETYQFEM